MARMTHSASKRGLRVYNIGPSSSICAFMVEIRWTTAQVVKITAREDFLLSGVTMDTKNQCIVDSSPSAKVLAGTTLYFVASSIPGYYYICRVTGAGIACCNCPAYRLKHACRHTEPVLAFAAKPRVPQVVVVSRPEPTVEPTPARIEEDSATWTPEQWKEAHKRHKEWEQAENKKYWEKVKEARAAAKAEAEGRVA